MTTGDLNIEILKGIQIFNIEIVHNVSQVTQLCV
jgi:hypothetical protein